MSTQRPSLRDHAVRSQVTPQGREAIYTPTPRQPSTVNPPSSTVDRMPSETTWEEAHRRVTFYCPLDLLRALESEMTRSRRSKTAVIVDAIREHLRAASPR